MTYILTEKQRKAVSLRNATIGYALLHARQERKLALKVASLFKAQTDEVIENIKKFPLSKSITKDALVNQWIFDTIKGRMYFAEALTQAQWQSMRLAGWRTFAELRLAPDDFMSTTPLIQAHIAGHVAMATNQVIDTQVNLFSAVLEQSVLAGATTEELIQRAKDTGNFAKRWRSVMIARTETTGALNFGDTEAAKQTGKIWGNEWVASLDQFTRPDHIAVNGKRVALGQHFPIVNGEYPGDPSMDVSEIVNCRCFLLKIGFDGEPI